MTSISDKKLRDNRLVFYKDDIELIDKVLAEFLRLSGSKCALLIDKEGHLVTKQGEVKSLNMDTISALVAGSFAATKEMAKLLGEEHFSCLFHQGERDNIQLSLVGDRTLLTILFDDRTTVGMVRRLERDGLLVRRADGDDARKVRLVLTPRARRLEARLMPYVEEVNEIALAGVSAADRATVKRVLAHVFANLSAAASADD